jgi:hypothetical protein
MHPIHTDFFFSLSSPAHCFVTPPLLFSFSFPFSDVQNLRMGTTLFFSPSNKPRTTRVLFPQTHRFSLPLHLVLQQPGSSLSQTLVLFCFPFISTFFIAVRDMFSEAHRSHLPLHLFCWS